MSKSKIYEFQVEYLLKWKNWSESDNTWEPVENLKCYELIEEFENSQPAQPTQPPKKAAAKKGTKKKAIAKNTAKNGTKNVVKNGAKNVGVAKKTNSVSKNKRKWRSFFSKIQSKLFILIFQRVQKAKKTNTPFDNGDMVDKILGATNVNGVMEFMVHWVKSDKTDIVPAALANEKIPALVIKYYEKRLVWKDRIDSEDEDEMVEEKEPEEQVEDEEEAPADEESEDGADADEEGDDSDDECGFIEVNQFE